MVLETPGEERGGRSGRKGLQRWVARHEASLVQFDNGVSGGESARSEVQL